MKEAKEIVNSTEFKREQQKYVQDALLGNVTISIDGKLIHTAEEAAQKFIDVLKDSINASGLSSDAAAAISNFKYDTPVCVGNKCTIKVMFDGDMHRKSLDPTSYPNGIDHLEELLDKGVDHRMAPVYGEWHGKGTWSRTTIDGAYFLDAAKRSFMASYGKEYNVSDITIEYEY